MAVAPAVGDTAAAHTTRNVPIAAPGQTVREVIEGMRGHDYDSVAAVAVCDSDGRLAGTISMARLLAAPDAMPADELMDAHPTTVEPGEDQERAAWAAVQNGRAAIAVVTEAGRFDGFVPPRSLLEVLLAEHEEDMARLGGYLQSTSKARSAATEGVARRLWHRLPWLVLGLLGALASALIVGSFEQQLEAQILVALFVPGVVYLADAVGTQTEALIIRGLSVGVSVSRVAIREVVTGVLLGAIFAVVSYPAVLLIWHEPSVALAVAIALFAASSIATLVAMVLPWLLSRFGGDPAFGSGPVATVTQDLLSIIIYFLTVAAVVPH